MAKKTALVTNVLDYVGPPAVKALLKDGYEVVAQDTAFKKTDDREQYESKNRGAIPVSFGDPNELINHLWEKFEKIDVLGPVHTMRATALPPQIGSGKAREERFSNTK